MDLATIDYWANAHTTYLHRVSATAKLGAAVLTIAAIAASQDLFLLLAIYLIVVGAIVATDLPVRRIVTLSTYPAVFALLYAVSTWNGNLYSPLVIVLKTLASSLTLVTLISTTPYPVIFTAAGYVLPAVVVQALFLTYRSIFILLGFWSNLIVALRLRGGISRHRYVQNFANLAAAIGPLLLRAIIASERIQDVLRLRGFSGHVVSGVRWRIRPRHDVVVLLPSFLVAVVSAVTRLHPDAARYDGFLLVTALLVLVSAIVFCRGRSRHEGEDA